MDSATIESVKGCRLQRSGSNHGDVVTMMMSIVVNI